MNLGGGGCSELRLCHCTPTWVTERDFVSKKIKIKKRNKKKKWPGAGAHTCNPALWEAKAGGSQDQEFEAGQHGETPSLLKIQKLARHGGAYL